MKVLFQSRSDLYHPRGGDTFQLESTKSALEKLDPTIHIDISLESHPKNIQEYDIVHLFNLDWICETYVQAQWAKKHHKPIVLSAIHHSYAEVERYEKLARYDIRRIYNAVIPWQSMRDVWKNIYRATFGFKFQKLLPTVVQIYKGIRATQREIIRMSRVVLVQTTIEAKDIEKDFHVADFTWKKVVNGVNTRIFSRPDRTIFQNYMRSEFQIDTDKYSIILNVGRIEPRKNQLNIIRAVRGIDQSKLSKPLLLVFFGARGYTSHEYWYRFMREIGNSGEKIGVVYGGEQPQEMIASAMAQHGVFVQASWFETTGLVSLEASLAGMPVVVSGDRVKEYLGDEGMYCDPADYRSIQSAILAGLDRKSVSSMLKKEILSQYTWEQTARQTRDVYLGIAKHGH